MVGILRQTCRTYRHEAVVGGVDLHEVGLQQVFHNLYALLHVILLVAVARSLVPLCCAWAVAAKGEGRGIAPVVSNADAHGPPRHAAHMQPLPIRSACNHRGETFDYRPMNLHQGQKVMDTP
jgi:hypothetical protein